MPQPDELKQWRTTVSMRMPQLSKAQAHVLALYSFGIALTRQCGLTTVSVLLSLLLGQAPNTLRQRLREWTYAAEAKRGQRRQAVTVSASFAPLLAWVLALWPLTDQLTLAVDVTYLGERLTVLAVSVVYGGSAIPVAWHVLAGATKGEWHPHWVRLLTTLQPAVPAGCQVYVLTDRGLYSKRLFQVITGLHWHPLMRIRTQGLWRRERDKTWRPLARLPRPGMGLWCHRAVCFKNDPLVCTLLVQWDALYDEPCLVITDCAPAQVQANHYALRAWIEAGFKDFKRGGLHWEHTKMTDPARVERLWLVLAVALLWLMDLGDQAHALWQEAALPASLSRLTLGWLTLLVQLIQPPPTTPFERYRAWWLRPTPLKTYP